MANLLSNFIRRIRDIILIIAILRIQITLVVNYTLNELAILLFFLQYFVLRYVIVLKDFKRNLRLHVILRFCLCSRPFCDRTYLFTQR